MATSSNNNQQNNKFSILLVLIFCVMIATPLVIKPFFSTNSDTKLNNENRLATNWPKLEFSLKFLVFDFVKYTNQINNYLDDHLVFRQSLLDLYAKLHFKLLGTGSSSNAVIGKNGWLYLSSSNALKNARGVTPLTKQEAEDWAQSAKLINDAVESYGGKFLIVIAPDKPQVYPEHLPDHIIYQRQGRRADTLGHALKDLNIDYLDLLDPLLTAKSNHASPLYFLTDTHWSYVGALSSYQTIIKQLNSYGFDLPIVETLQLRIIHNDDFSGDLARLLNLEDDFYEDKRVLLPHRSVSTFDRDKELLLFGDSFTGIEIPYLEYSFTKVTCVHHNWGSVNLDLIKQEQADIVVMQMVERGLEFPLSADSDSINKCGGTF